MADTARSCSQCEETDFEHVYGAVWRCKACGTLSGNVEELAEQPGITKEPKQVKRRLNIYEAAAVKCVECRGIVYALRYPTPGEFLKLQEAWKQHHCQQSSLIYQ